MHVYLHTYFTKMGYFYSLETSFFHLTVYYGPSSMTKTTVILHSYWLNGSNCVDTSVCMEGWRGWYVYTEFLELEYMLLL